MLTPAAVKAARPQPRAYKLFDAGGLFLFIAPTGLKSWRVKYRRAGREQLLTIGRFPEISLPEARQRRDEARARLAAGGDPAVVHFNVNSLEQLGRAWHAHARDQWSAEHATDVLASLERDIFPALGNRAAGEIAAPELLAALRVVEGRGCIETARRLRQRLSMIFAYGVAEGLIENDPAARLAAAMRKGRPARPQPALVSIEDCRQLLEACETVGAGASVRLASRFLALTAVRLDAVRGARWGEIEDLDGPAPLWRVPSERMKLARAKKGDARFDHVVPLSAEACGVLREAMLIFATSNEAPKADSLLFPGAGKNLPLGEGAIGALYARAGFAGRHVPHGWRASFSTILNEELGEEWRAAIDRALAHSPKDKVEGAYNRAEQLGRRRALFARWGALLADGRQA